MISADDRQKFLDKLEDIPIVSVVCRQVGISKATIYRWRDEDAKFKKRYDKAMKRGRESIVDHAESKLLKLVDKENLGAIRMVLEANSKRYYKPRQAMKAPRTVEPISGFRIEIMPDNLTKEERARREEDTRRQNAETARRRMGEEMKPEDDILP